MSHTNKTIRLSAKTFLLSIGLTLVACGGGGGGGGNGIPNATVQYSGNTLPATVNTAEVEEIAKSYISADEENYSGIVAGVTISSPQGSLDKKIKDQLIEKLKQDALASIQSNESSSESLVTGATATSVSYGNCADIAPELELENGTASNTIMTNNPNEVIIKTTYNNLCLYISDTATNTDAYVVLNGDLYYWVTGDLQNGRINFLKFIIPGLSIKAVDLSVNPVESINVTLSENLIFTFENYDIDGFPLKTTIQNYTDVESGGLVYRFEVVSITENGLTDTQVRFYHPTYGYIEYVSTLTFGCSNGSADSGSLVISDANATYTLTPSAACDNSFAVETSTPTATTPTAGAPVLN